MRGRSETRALDASETVGVSLMVVAQATTLLLLGREGVRRDRMGRGPVSADAAGEPDRKRQVLVGPVHDHHGHGAVRVEEGRGLQVVARRGAQRSAGPPAG